MCLLLLRYISLFNNKSKMHHTIDVDPETYELEVTVLGDFKYTGNFAQAVGDYLAEANTAAAHVDKKVSLKGCAYEGPLAEYEQVLLALWATVPKFVFSDKYRDMLAALSHVMYYFQTGDIEGFEETIRDCSGFGFYTRPADVLDFYLEDLENLFHVEVVEEVEEEEDVYVEVE